MPLVAWHALPREASAISEDLRLAPLSLLAGRGWVFLGALLTLVAFLLPVLTITGETELHANMFRFASLRAGKLWMVPLAAIAQIMILFRRRTLRGMRSARVAVGCVALMPSLALALTLQRVTSAARALALRSGDADVGVHVEWGSYLVFFAGVVMLFGAVRLGVAEPSSEPRESESM